MEFQHVSPKSLVCWRVRLYLIAAVAAVAVSLFFTPFTVLWYWMTGVWVAAFLGMYFVYYPIKYRRLQFRVENGGVQLDSGVIYKYNKYMKIENIQYVNFVCTPLQRILKLKSAVIMAAGGYLYLPCLSAEQAQTLTRALHEGGYEI